MSDEDIIKALECCTGDGLCCECPMWQMLSANCIVELNRLALEIIKRQQAEQPSADVAPVRHGHWIECNYGLTFECSECKYPTEYNLTDYCPNCGAKMDGDKNG